MTTDTKSGCFSRLKQLGSLDKNVFQSFKARPMYVRPINSPFSSPIAACVPVNRAGGIEVLRNQPETGEPSHLRKRLLQSLHRHH